VCGGSNEGTESNNYPLRGGKGSLWEGGVRAAAVLQGPGIATRGLVSDIIHVTDWVPTLVAAARGLTNNQDTDKGAVIEEEATAAAVVIDPLVNVFSPGGTDVAAPLSSEDGVNQWDWLREGGTATSRRTSVVLEAHPPCSGDNCPSDYHGNAYIDSHMKLLWIG
jgi:arylsulfatase A-like enzyme